MKRPKSLRIEETELVLPGQEAIRSDLQARCRDAVRVAIQAALDQRLAEFVGAEPYEHNLDRVDYRNGSYGRVLVTALGPVQGRLARSAVRLQRPVRQRLPAFRNHISPRHIEPSQTIGRWHRGWPPMRPTICA
jgi:hypothetical protein